VSARVDAGERDGAAAPDGPAFWFYRHAEIPSHQGDLPATSAGLRRAEEVGSALAADCPRGARVEFPHAPTVRTVQTAEALRRGFERGLPPGAGIRMGEVHVEPAIRNPDLYVAGHRVEMVSALDAVAAQLPSGALTRPELERNAFFSRFLGVGDRIGLWVADDDPPGERADDVARRIHAWAHSLCDIERPYPRRYVCVTHSGPMRALLRRYVLDRDPGEPEYVEAVQLAFGCDGTAHWRFRDAVASVRAG
jgi:broad specificity phosphatase PhoE